MYEERNDKDIELRSEKVRNIVGKVPPRLYRVGISIISIILLLTLVLAYIIPYPEYKTTSINLSTIPIIQTIEAPLSGTFFFDLSQERVEVNQKICTVRFENDSMVNYYSEYNGIFLCNYKNEDKVEQGDIIFSIIPDSISLIYGISLIPLDDMKNIKKGQTVIITSVEQQSIKGCISKLYPIQEINRSNGELSKKVEIQLIHKIQDIDKSLLYPNANLSCKILISNKPILKRILKD